MHVTTRFQQMAERCVGAMLAGKGTVDLRTAANEFSDQRWTNALQFLRLEVRRQSNGHWHLRNVDLALVKGHGGPAAGCRYLALTTSPELATVETLANDTRLVAIGPYRVGLTFPACATAEEIVVYRAQAATRSLVQAQCQRGVDSTAHLLGLLYQLALTRMRQITDPSQQKVVEAHLFYKVESFENVFAASIALGITPLELLTEATKHGW